MSSWQEGWHGSSNVRQWDLCMGRGLHAGSWRSGLRVLHVQAILPAAALPAPRQSNRMLVVLPSEPTPANTPCARLSRPIGRPQQE